MVNEKISEYASTGEIQPKDLHDISVSPFGVGSSKSATQYQITGGEKISKVFGDFAAAAASFDLVVFTLKAGRKLQELVLKHEDAWVDGSASISEVKVELGIVGNAGKYVFEPFDIFQPPGDGVLTNEEPKTIEDWNNDVDIVMRITAVGGDLDTLVDGSIDLFIFTKSMKP